MSVFVIPRHKRFAVRHHVQLRNARGTALAALLIEISQEACRVSPFGKEPLEVNQPVTIEISGFGDIAGRVFSAGDKVLSIRFLRPIQGSALHELVWSPNDEAKPILQLPAFGVWNQGRA
jgi:hypothetical protein